MTTFLTIAQVAEATGLSTHTLRYYERIGLLDSVQRRDNGHRVFRAEDMTWLEFLLRLRDTGMPIAQMQAYAALRRQGDSLESVSARQRLLELHAAALEAELRARAETLAVLRVKLVVYDGIRARIEAVENASGPASSSSKSKRQPNANRTRTRMTPNTHTAQAANHANLQDDRYVRGWQKLKEVDDVAGERVVEAMADISPDLGRYIVEFGFGDVYSRPGLTLREREIATIAALTALGNAAPQLKVHIAAGLNVGSRARRSPRRSCRWRYTRAFRRRSTACLPPRKSLPLTTPRAWPRPADRCAAKPATDRSGGCRYRALQYAAARCRRFHFSWECA